jgi:hypothetical protein
LLVAYIIAQKHVKVTATEAVQFLVVTALPPPHAQNEEQQKAESVLWCSDLKSATKRPAPLPSAVSAQRSLEEVSQMPI